MTSLNWTSSSASCGIIVTDIIMNVVYVQVDVTGLRVYRVMLIFLFLSDARSVLIDYYLDNHRLFTMYMGKQVSPRFG